MDLLLLLLLLCTTTLKASFFGGAHSFSLSFKYTHTHTMLRRQPTSVTLTAEDVELFKQLLSDLQEKKNQKSLKEKQDEIAVEDGDPDDIFMGRSLLLNERKRRREVEARLGLTSEEQQQQTGEASSSKPLFKRVHL